MAYAITGTCCSDASCVAVCPVGCIHPTPGEPGFGTAEMLHVDPDACIDCGACADACPVDAVVPVDRLAPADAVYAELNRAYFDGRETRPFDPVRFPRSLPQGAGPLRVAVVGTGPAAAYTARALLRTTGAQITLLERLPVAGGLVRFGVAPDHPGTRRIGRSFAAVAGHPQVTTHLGVEVGRDVSHAELLAHHAAVVYAVGAPADRALGVPGEDLPGSVAAGQVVRWYNGHPEHPDAPDLRGPRAVVVGTGNVALDVARLLLSGPDRLAGTDIAPGALAALSGSGVREVVLLGRRGPEHLACSSSELRALLALPSLQTVVVDTPGVRAALRDAAPGSAAALLADLPLVPDGPEPLPGAPRRLVLRLGSPVDAVAGSARVTGVLVGGAAPVLVPAGLVVRAVGHRGQPLPDLPFDEATGTVPSDRGRVVDPATGAPVPGTYVVGWAKRGASGGIGTNRTDAEETVDVLLDDLAAGRLAPPARSARQFARLVRSRTRRGTWLPFPAARVTA